jgi:hypothetical protein
MACRRHTAVEDSRCSELGRPSEGICSWDGLNPHWAVILFK